MTQTANPTRARRNFAIFSVGVIGAGWLGLAVDRAGGIDTTNGVALSNDSGTTGLAIFIAGPVLLALALYFLSRDGAGPLGLRINVPARWWLGALALYPTIVVIVVGLGLVVGAATLTGTAAPGKPALLTAIVTVFAVQVVKNLLEEFAFRGYGTRTAVALGLPGAYTPHVLVGIVWALWHLPLYLVWTSAEDLRLITSLSWPLFLPLLVLGLIAASIVYGELRVRTGSIWPGVLLHSVSNAIATPLLVNGHLGFAGAGDVFFSPVPSSLLTLVLFGLVGVFLVRRSTVDNLVPVTR